MKLINLVVTSSVAPLDVPPPPPPAVNWAVLPGSMANGLTMVFSISGAWPRLDDCTNEIMTTTVFLNKLESVIFYLGSHFGSTHGSRTTIVSAEYQR